MADACHLERMGRELKCPICLSLLNSSVSLSCNHVFCNCCIEKSMKSASNCPVCKVPFRCREIRPAPHMDNLVSIYKSMEVASGVNIFVTQTAPSTKISGCETHPNDDIVSEIQENRKTCIGTTAQDNQKRCRKMGPTRSAQADGAKSSVNPLKLSFPAKKRVHVPQCPPSEVPIRSEKLANETAEITKIEADSYFTTKDKPEYKETGEPLFAPFFWLRNEEDSEKTTQQTDGDGDQIMETPPDAPCFSDIKESDDEVPNEMPSDGKTCIAYSDADFFDSEMFEWTQRACSPELHSSPVNMQADDRTQCGEEKKGSSSPVSTTIMESKVQNTEIMIRETDEARLSLPFSSSSFTMDNIVSKGIEMTGKRIKKAVQNRENKRAKTTTNNTSRAHKESEKMAGQSMQDEKLENIGSVLNLTKKTSNKRIKKVSFDAIVTEAAGSISTSSSGANHGDIKIVVDLPALPDHKKHINGSNLKKLGKISKKNVSPLKKRALRSRAKKLKAATQSLTPNQCDVLISHLPKELSSDKKEVSAMRRVLRKCGGNHSRKKKNFKIVRFSEGNQSGDTLVDNSHNNQNNQKIAAKHIESSGANQDKSISRGTVNLSRLDAIHLLSGTSPSKIWCAFCQSSEDSEPSGVMVHYLKGKSIAGDEIKGPNVIHSHKNCAEWAPNIFFKDDRAINLEAELARSRKIKCGLCGIRGAALGCFQKSCRKSFHVPCAKMTPKFRWDFENFVLLCPLHASCKLPCESPGSQSNQKMKPASKGDSPTQQPLEIKDYINEDLQWKSHRKAKNLFLCCSGLTDVEKNIVSQFERLSRVTVLKDWDRSVTHVVASTDENGACKRTLKFLMGVLEGKWIVNIDWVKTCIKSMELVDEQLYEIKADSHGIRDGPNRGRLRILDKKPKLFSGCEFYFMGEFVPSYRGYLHDLVIAAGGTVLNRKPILKNQEVFSSKCSTLTTFIVYSSEQLEKCGASKRNSVVNCRCLDAQTLATSTRAVAIQDSSRTTFQEK
ncbi:hypothetical protein ACH5RR_015565 [Cinchona calisaya]|uniref:Uncharacterized protein n=1 Tax=Cinchona calisaya TaxID=153742 RepID=A0ABD2ZVE6_9GENT